VIGPRRLFGTSRANVRCQMKGRPAAGDALGPRMTQTGHFACSAGRSSRRVLALFAVGSIDQFETIEEPPNVCCVGPPMDRKTDKLAELALVATALSAGALSISFSLLVSLYFP